MSQRKAEIKLHRLIGREFRTDDLSVAWRSTICHSLQPQEPLSLSLSNVCLSRNQWSDNFLGWTECLWTSPILWAFGKCFLFENTLMLFVHIFMYTFFFLHRGVFTDLAYVWSLKSITLSFLSHHRKMPLDKSGCGKRSTWFWKVFGKKNELEKVISLGPYAHQKGTRVWMCICVYLCI